MALNVKDPEADRLARELAAATGETITVATRRALEERLARTRRRSAAGATVIDELRGTIQRGRSRTVLDPRSPTEVIGYDDAGLPR